MRRRIILVLAAWICAALLAGMGKGVAYAEEESSGDAFSGNLELLKQEDDNYVMQVTVANKGEDFSGLVQLVFASSTTENCAYNTEITLPAQGRKQFTVTVTERAVDPMKGLCAMNFLDEKGKLVQTISLKNVFGNAVSAVSVGVLSDDYAGLGYMDAGGIDIEINRFQGDSFPPQLVELTQDNLRAYLDGLYFLIIDQFNVASLGREDIQAIQKWVKAGGWLIIGTGAYAEQTLSGFEPDFLDLSVAEVREPGAGDNRLLANAQRYGYYSGYLEEEIDFSKMAVAELNMNSMTGYNNESSQNPAILSNYGEGGVAVYLISLGEQELQKLDNYAIRYMYEEVMWQSDSYRFYGGRDNMEYVGRSALARIDSTNTGVDFSWLKVLIALYVVLAGPVLYLVLRKCRKSEWYWVGVPVLGLVFILAVFVFGKDMRVTGTKVYSVTVQRTDSGRMDTYLLAYHSGLKPWEVRLRDDYEVAGTGWCGYYAYNNSTSDYAYYVTNDSQGMAVGMKPQENFESGYLYAGGKAERKGDICGRDIRDDQASMGGRFSGTVTNDTGFDLAYMAVWHDTHIMVYRDVRAGETLDLYQEADARCVYETPAAEDVDELRYNMLSRYNNGKIVEYRMDDMAALLIGLGVARDTQPADGDYGLVVGVIKDYDKAVTSKCSEVAYGCLYTYTKMEVDQGAAN